MADKPKKNGRQNYDWVTIMHDYVTTPGMTLQKISEKYDIRVATVYKRSKEYGWVDAKKRHLERVTEKAIAKTGNLQAKELSQESDFLKMMKGHMDRMLSDDQQFQRHLTTNMVTGETTEDVYAKTDTKAMREAMQTLKMIEEMSRSLYNIQKGTEIQKHQIDADRLKLEQEKLEWEKQKADMMKPDATNTIKIEGFEKGWAE